MSIPLTRGDLDDCLAQKQQTEKTHELERGQALIKLHSYWADRVRNILKYNLTGAILGKTLLSLTNHSYSDDQIILNQYYSLCHPIRSVFRCSFFRKIREMFVKEKRDHGNFIPIGDRHAMVVILVGQLIERMNIQYEIEVGRVWHNCRTGAQGFSVYI